MNRAKRMSIIVVGIALFWGWQALPVPRKVLTTPAEAVEKTEKSGGGESESYGIKDLTCFKCHIYERFLQEPAPGVFSHALHVQFDYHCNQCHSFRGHRQMVINTKICTFCHDVVPKLKKP